MPSEKFLQQIGTIESCFPPVDMAAAANNGDWLSLENYQRALIVLFKEAGAAGEDPVFKLQQAKDNAGGSAKDLLFATIYEKIGTLNAVTAWTRKTQTAATSYTNDASAEAEGIIAVEISADDLDVDNGFKFFRLEVADTGATAGQLGGAFAIMFDPRYPQASLVSAES